MHYLGIMILPLQKLISSLMQCQKYSEALDRFPDGKIVDLQVWVHMMEQVPKSIA